MSRDDSGVERAFGPSGELSRQLIENVPAPVAVFDREMRYLLASRRFLTDYRLRWSDVIGRSHYEVFPEMPERWKEVHRRCLAGASESCDQDPFIRADGSLDWVRWAIQPWRASGGEIGGIVLYSEVITERKRMEEELEKREHTLSMLLDKINAAVALSSLPDGRLVRVNTAFETMFGYTKAEAVGRTSSELGIHDDPERRARRLAEANRGGAVTDPRMPLRTRSGETRIFAVDAQRVEIDGRPYVLSSAQDMTERDRAEEDLRASEERFRATFEQAAVGIAHVAPDGRWLRINRKLCEIVGYSRDELLGMTFQDITHPDDLAADLDYVRRMLAGEIQSYSMEKRYFRKDRSIVWINLTVGLVRGPAGRPDYFISVVEDISERRRAEEERASLESQLRQAQKMEAVGQLAGGIAHDFNNMLGVILGYTELAMTQLPAGSPVHAHLAGVVTAAQRSADLTRQLLAFARKQTISPRVLDLNVAIASTLKLLQRITGENIAIAWTPDPEACIVRMDPSQIDQILFNLVVNAKDAIAGTGRIAIETRVVGPGGDEAAHAMPAPLGEVVLLRFSDDGRGMDRATLERVFEPFFTTKEHGRGSGLGLATVYGIVQQNQGRIEVASEPGRGTTFSIWLPRCERAEVESAARAAAPRRRPGAETVLIVEDEESILRLATLMLGGLGYRVLTATTAQEALRMVEVDRVRLDLLITDVVMPEMDGTALAQRLGTAIPGLKCLYMSGYASDVLGDRGVIDEGTPLLQKPFSMAALADEVRRVLDAR